MEKSQYSFPAMSSPSVHFDDSTSQVILITDLDSNASSPPNDTLEDGEALRPKIDLEMSAKILEMAKTPIVDPESSLTLINNWGDQLSPEAVTALHVVLKLKKQLDCPQRQRRLNLGSPRPKLRLLSTGNPTTTRCP